MININESISEELARDFLDKNFVRKHNFKINKQSISLPPLMFSGFYSENTLTKDESLSIHRDAYIFYYTSSGFKYTVDLYCFQRPRSSITTSVFHKKVDVMLNYYMKECKTIRSRDFHFNIVHKDHEDFGRIHVSLECSIERNLNSLIKFHDIEKKAYKNLVSGNYSRKIKGRGYKKI